MKRSAPFLLSLVLFMFMVSPAFAQANLGLHSIGVGVGAVDPEDVDMTVSFGFWGDLGTIRPNIHLETFLGYWQKTEEVVDGAEFHVRDFAVVMRTKYVFDLENPTIKPFAGGGLGFHFINAGVDVPAMDIGGLITPAYSVDDSEIKIGLEFGGGMTFDVSPSMGIQTEGWYSIVSDVSQLAIRVGLIFNLGG